ncbi:MAG: TolC family protein [Gemmatimonadales bacterium]
MRFILAGAGLAIFAGTAVGQQPAPAIEPTHPECVAPGAPAAPSARGLATDSLCVTRSAAIAVALAANPQIQIAGAQAQQARARKVEGVALPDPQFTAEWDYSKWPFGAGGGVDRILGAELTVPFIDKFRLNGRIGTAGIRQSEFDSIAVRQAIASQTAQTYDSLLAALRHRADLQQDDSLARDFLTKTQARFDAGTVPRLDVVNAQVAVAQSDNELITNERDIANARASLDRLLGRPLTAPVATADSLAVPAAPPGVERLVAIAAAHRPELASLQSQVQGAHASTDLAREFWLPDLTVGVSRDYLAPSPGYVTTAISFPIPILYWNHSRGEIAEARYYEQELEATYRDAQAAVAQDVQVAYATATAALRQAILLRDQLLPAAAQAYRIATASYGLGGSSALEVNAARLALVDAESQYTDALAAASSARWDLERAIGTSLTAAASGGNP